VPAENVIAFQEGRVAMSSNVHEGRWASGKVVSSGFRDMRISGKLMVLVSVVCSLLLAIGLVGAFQLGAAQDRLKAMYRDSLQAILWLGTVSADYQAIRVEMTNLALLGTKGHDAAVTAMQALDADIAANWSAYIATDMTGREAPRDAFIATWGRYRNVRDTQLLPLADQGQVTDYIAARKAKILPLAHQIEASLADLRRIEQASAQRSLDDAQRAYDMARVLIFGMIVTAILLALAIAFSIARMISRPLGRTVTVLEGLAGGRLDQRVGVTGRDEVGRMAVALDTAIDQIGGTLREIGGNVDTLAGSADGLRAVAARMTDSARRSAAEADNASAGAEQVGQNATTVAGGSEEMRASIAEISANATNAADVANRAVTASQDASRILAKLGESSDQIVAVVQLITSIAEQTNLLALNATIEAARAGDAGKGFAVVASEVKDLAQETAKATEDITARVSSIQADSGKAVAAIAAISEVIEQINSSQATIAAAVEEQTATTSEMSRNISEVATGSHNISATLTSVAQSAAETTDAARDTARASDELSHLADALRHSLTSFRM
jgi:methyl-accepting chemotaxis protein